MPDLDNVQRIIDEDKKGVLQATEMLADQCQQAWEETQAIQLPLEYQDITNAVTAGMGGSHLGTQLINAVHKPSLKVPLIVCNDYQLPGYVNDKTLVMATSVSGNTEETLYFAAEALKRQAKIICISSGGKLAEFAKTNNLPNYTFESKYNPSRIPRYGSGYLFAAQMSFLAKAGIINLTESDIQTIITTIRSQKQKYTLTVPTGNNFAKQLALTLLQKSIVLVASEHLTGAAYICKNLFNESAKNFAALFELPELNHHLLEGLQYPDSNEQNLHFIFFESDLYYERNRKRYAITEEIIRNQKITVSTLKMQSPTTLSQAFELVTFASYASLYLSILNHVDPGPNPWVDYLKQKLSP